MRFLADDGKFFDSLEECKKHEDKINNLNATKAKREKEVEDAYEKYRKLANSYRDDYGEDPHMADWSKVFTRIFV